MKAFKLSTCRQYLEPKSCLLQKLEKQRIQLITGHTEQG